MIKRFYIPLLSACTQLEERQRNVNLRRAVEGWWVTQGWGIPQFPTTITYQTTSPFGPDELRLWRTAETHKRGFRMAALPRQVATTRYEDRLFVLMAKYVGLDPTWLEYTGDQFYEGSPGKKSLLHLHRCSGRGRNGGWKLRKQRLACLNQWNHALLNTIVTDDEQSLVEVHHAWQDKMFDQPRRIDMTSWLKKIGNAKQYYAAALSLYVCHGVLFEDFHGGESGEELRKLAQNVFEPAFDTVCSMFGVLPLIVRLPWKEQLGFYPDGDRWNDEIIVDLLNELTP